jgi:hypothetical protein
MFAYRAAAVSDGEPYHFTSNLGAQGKQAKQSLFKMKQRVVPSSSHGRSEPEIGSADDDITESAEPVKHAATARYHVPGHAYHRRIGIRERFAKLKRRLRLNHAAGFPQSLLLVGLGACLYVLLDDGARVARARVQSQRLRNLGGDITRARRMVLSLKTEESKARARSIRAKAQAEAVRAEVDAVDVQLRELGEREHAMEDRLRELAERESAQRVILDELAREEARRHGALKEVEAQNATAATTNGNATATNGTRSAKGCDGHDVRRPPPAQQPPSSEPPSAFEAGQSEESLEE